jgi:hypothetical protein
LRVAIVDILRHLLSRLFNSPHPAFNLQLQVSRARFVSAKAELERVLQTLEAKTIRTSRVGSIQKGTVRKRFGHGSLFSRRTNNAWFIGDTEHLT